MSFGVLDVLNVGGKILDKLFPDAKEREAYKLQLQQLANQGNLDELNRAFDAITSEARSGDKWTSRARPSFMYVIYLLLLAAIPFGIVYAVNPDVAKNISLGVNAWFTAIPDSLYQLFGVGYVGYSTARSFDKAMTLKRTK